MNFGFKITTAEDWFEEIMCSLELFNRECYLAALQFKHYNEKKLVNNNERILESTRKLQNQYDRLTIHAKTFNHLIFTKHNGLFTTSADLLKRIDSGTKEIKHIYKQYCERAKQDRVPSIYGDTPASVITYSHICASSFQQDLFGIESCPPIVTELYFNMKKFFELMAKCIKLCNIIIEQEEEARNSPEYCNLLYEEFKKRCESYFFKIKELVPESSIRLAAKTDPLVAERRKVKDQATFAQNVFHRFAPEDANVLILHEMYEVETETNLTPEEQVLFDRNIEKAQLAKYLIARFDELLPCTHKREKICARTMHRLYDKLKLRNVSMKNFYDYFCKEYRKSADNKHELICYDAFRAPIENNGLKTQKEEKEFNEKMEILSNRAFSFPKAL